ncbi:hypothetical protein WJX74_001787 [Apatococcus lobatus]|uniref:Uncharacterized protein n=2 Tax=Apatococcus TaxID=904362 RepID=A0AAW1S7S5_9CHLO
MTCSSWRTGCQKTPFSGDPEVFKLPGVDEILSSGTEKVLTALGGFESGIQASPTYTERLRPCVPSGRRRE